MQVLKVTNQGKEISLDDKNLIQEFDKFKNDNTFADKFIHNLLQYRFWFDQNIIKRNRDTTNWVLKTLESDNKENKNIIMIQSMFQVSFPSKSNKNWLQSILKNCYSENTTNEESGSKIIRELEEIAKKRLEGINICDLHYNDNRPSIFLFHLMDYLIWKENQKAEVNKDYKIEKISEFSFKFRNSIEHFYPQNPQNAKKIEQETLHFLHSFGNLALTTSSQNSKWSNFLPKDKLQYLGAEEEKSLKFQLMIQKANEWNKETIENHQEAMSKLLKEFLKNT